MMKLTRRSIMYATILVWLHAIIALLHGLAHFENSVWLSLLETAFVMVVIALAPLLALWILHSRWQSAGALLLTLSMLGALIFGVWNHFLVPGTDNVAQVLAGTWYLPFLITSILLAILEVIGVGIGAWCLYSLARYSPSYK
jgi:glucose dehydrogenase